MMSDRPFHLVTDLDGTWISDKDSREHLGFLENTLRACPNATLTFATTRSLDSALQLLEGAVTLFPAHFITGGGVRIFHRLPGNQWAEDAAYAARVEAQWDEPGALRYLKFWVHKDVRPARGMWDARKLAFEPQPGIALEEARESLQRSVAATNFHADIISGHDGRLYAVPKGVTKGTALAYLEAHVDLPRPMVACGNSQNDVPMFQMADLVILMADSPLGFEARGLPRERVYRPATPGPAGIYEALLAEAFIA
jgi:hypothetical protein